MSVLVEHVMNYVQFIPTIAAWQQQEFGYLSPEGTVEQRIDRLKSASDRDRLPIALIALSQDRNALVGSASLLANSLTHRHLSPWLSSVFVPPEHRGNGIASILALAAASEAKRLGFDTLYLFTPRKEALYSRLGWVTFDSVVLNGVGVSIMARSVR
jgi:GNAT superfamily N-acetyltransferase